MCWIASVCPSLNRSPAGSAAGAGSVRRSGADAGSAVPSRISARMISGTPIAPSRLSGGRLRSLPLPSGSARRGPPPGRAPGSWSATTGVPVATFTPTVTASTVTLSIVTGSLVRARMPSLDRPTLVPEIVVAASASIPVRPPVTRPPMIWAPGEKLRTASFSTPSAIRSRMTTPVVPAVVTRPSWPPLSLRPVATTLPAPRSMRTPVRESLTLTPSMVDVVAADGDPGDPGAVDRRVADLQALGGLLDHHPAPAAGEVEVLQRARWCCSRAGTGRSAGRRW